MSISDRKSRDILDRKSRIENQICLRSIIFPELRSAFGGQQLFVKAEYYGYIMRTDRIIDIYRIFWRVYRKNLPRTFLRASDLQRSFWRSAYDAMPNNLVQVKWGRTRKWSVHSGPKWSEKSVNWLREQKREIRPTLVKSDQHSWNQTNTREIRPTKKLRIVYVSLLSSQSCTTAWIQNIRVKRGTLFTV